MLAVLVVVVKVIVRETVIAIGGYCTGNHAGNRNRNRNSSSMSSSNGNVNK